MTSTETSPDARYKFVVSSADEAVSVLRERLGENAKVISVRQIEGAGLARFLRAPKLEIIARVEAPSPYRSPESQSSRSPWPTSRPGARRGNRREDRKTPGRGEARPNPSSSWFQRGHDRAHPLARLLEKLVKLPLGAALTEIAVILRGDYMRPPANHYIIASPSSAPRAPARRLPSASASPPTFFPQSPRPRPQARSRPAQSQ